MVLITLTLLFCIWEIIGCGMESTNLGVVLLLLRIPFIAPEIELSESLQWTNFT